jgi:hypothetical protein
MKYYIVPSLLAEQLNLTEFRKGNATVGYVVTNGDLAVIGLDAAIAAGAEEISKEEARQIISKIK